MEIIIIFFLLVLNGVFAMFEIALVSARKSLLEERASFGNTGAKVALHLLKEPERILSAIQVGITLIGIVSGAFGGIALADDFAPFLRKFPMISEYAEVLSVTIVVGLITYLSLIIGELVPKTIALNNAEKITIALSPAMAVFGKINKPVVSFLSFSTKLVLKILRIKPKADIPVSEEELKMLLKQGSEQGIIEKEESQIISEVFRFGTKRAQSIMTPRVDVIWLDVDDPFENLVQTALNSGLSRFPVTEGGSEDIKGFVSIKDIFAHEHTSEVFDIRDIIAEPLFIPERMLAVKVLELFRQTKIHYGIVINEYGALEGVITLHDIVENIIGDFPSIDEVTDDMVVIRNDGSYLVDGWMPLDDLEDLLKIQSLFEDAGNTPEISTLGGFMMFRLERVPSAGEKFSFRNYKFEVVDMDGNRVDKVMISRV